MENLTPEQNTSAPQQHQPGPLPEPPKAAEPPTQPIPDAALKGVDIVPAAAPQTQPGLNNQTVAPTQPEPPIKKFDDPRFWKGFYDAIDRNVVSGRIPKFFCISPTRAEKFLQCAKTQFPNFDASKIKSAEEISMNIMKKDGSGSYPLGIVISNFVVDKPDEDCGIFV
jgi:hypothetical protein